MKNKIYGWLILLAVALSFSACEGPMGPPGRDGIANKMILDFQVKAADWQTVTNNAGTVLYYQCFFDVPQLTQNIYDNAAIVAYYEVNEGGFMVQKNIPYIIENLNPPNNCTQTIDFDYSVGSVGFYVQYSDFAGADGQSGGTPGDMHFRVAILW